MSNNYGMDKDVYIKSLEKKIVTLEQRLAMLEQQNETLKRYNQELERRLGMNLQNSSKPPSSDPPGTTLVLPRRRCGHRFCRRREPG